MNPYMKITKRTKEETIKHFREISMQYKAKAEVAENMEEKRYCEGQAFGFEMAAFELEHNME